MILLQFRTILFPYKLLSEYLQTNLKVLLSVPLNYLPLGKDKNHYKRVGHFVWPTALE